MPKINLKDTKDYVSISPDGDFRLPSKEGEEGAVKRKYETSTGETGVKWEILANSIAGKITNVDFVTTDFGTLLQVTLDGEVIISLGTNSNFGSDIMKKLPNMDMEKTYLFSPYSFVGDNGKNVRGVNITEGDEYDKDAPKVTNFFRKDEKNINGMPEPKDTGKPLTKNQWKAYFGEVEDFLVEYTEKNIKPKFMADDEIDIDEVANAI